MHKAQNAKSGAITLMWRKRAQKAEISQMSIYLFFFEDTGIQNGATTKNWSRSNAFFSCDTCFFPATHVSKVFGPDTAPIRPRYGPDTAPIRPRYGPDTATEVHFSKNSTAKGLHFLKKSEL